MEYEFDYDTVNGETITVLGYSDGRVPKFSIQDENGESISKSLLTSTDIENIMDLLYEEFDVD